MLSESPGIRADYFAEALEMYEIVLKEGGGGILSCDYIDLHSKKRHTYVERVSDKLVQIEPISLYQTDCVVNVIFNGVVSRRDVRSIELPYAICLVAEINHKHSVKKLNCTGANFSI